ncbi:MAG TPA: ABC transporter ATP-binding protein [Candidatus Thermoplasmatota archaeon]|nr:ABC transporter ATP-binding protein [Candidatus Thermoplasmatota archaeon]
MGVLTAQGLSRYHGEVVGVNDLTVDFEPGITGLLGPNGAGKTTLFRMATGLMRPSAGTIRVLGEDPWDNAKLLTRIAYVPDGEAPWKESTGRAAVVRMGRYGGLDKAEAEAAAAAALARVGLTAAADRPVGTYSRGMQQRLKFAFALLHKPELYLLDEPLIATDPLTRRDLVKLIRDLAREGSSVVISTHVLPDVEALTERIALMAKGRLLAHGTVQHIRELLDRYPRTVRIGTPSPRELGLALWSMDSVLSMEATEGGVIVRTRQPGVFYEDLQRALETKAIPFTSITPLDENVEAIFRYLVSE